MKRTYFVDKPLSRRYPSTHADGGYRRKGSFPFLSLPRELRNLVYDLIVPRFAAWNSRSGRGLDVAYLLVNPQFASEIMAQYQLQTISAEGAEVAVPQWLRAKHVLRHVYKMHLTVHKAAFPGAGLVAAADGCTAMILQQSLRVLHLELTSATGAYHMERFAKTPANDLMFAHMRDATAGRCRPDPATGVAPFWSAAEGQKLLDLVTHARLEAASLSVAADGHWALFCPFHEPVGGGGCQPVGDHWSGSNMVCVLPAGGGEGDVDNISRNSGKKKTTLAVDLASLPGWAEKRRDAASRSVVEEAYFAALVADNKRRVAREKEALAALEVQPSHSYALGIDGQADEHEAGVGYGFNGLKTGRPRVLRYACCLV